MMRAKIAARARADVHDHAVYLESRRRGYARRFLLAFQSTVRRIERSPTSRAFYGFRAPDLLDVRVCAVDGFGNLLVFFRVTADGLEVLRVLHGARNIADLEEEMLPE